ncbi:MAG: hypothetical protein H6589_07090 [Flavobacteriales bacterium]|nr:hypothetical protein [Flavobacteriales bacterium]
MKNESFVIKKDIDTTYKIVLDSLQKVGSLKNQDNVNFKVEGIVWYGLQRIKVFIVLASEKKTTEIQIKATSDDILEIGASKSIEKLMNEIISISKNKDNSKSVSEEKNHTKFKSNKPNTSFKINYKILLTAFVAIISIWLMFFSNKNNEDFYYTKSGFGAAFNEKDFDLLLSCSVKNDLQCIQNMINSGSAIELHSGTKVYIVKSTFMGGVIIRPEGETYNLWTVKEALTK